ncbi:hypothetical protein IFR05_009123 [Cadophora sp. M221]|nr:hypothetical protein IFR05_009123 [Cadophora sp. M221]
MLEMQNSPDKGKLELDDVEYDDGSAKPSSVAHTPLAMSAKEETQARSGERWDADEVILQVRNQYNVASNIWASICFTDPTIARKMAQAWKQYKHRISSPKFLGYFMGVIGSKAHCLVSSTSKQSPMSSLRDTKAADTYGQLKVPNLFHGLILGVVARHHYLQEALQLFAAVSSMFDPLRDESSTESDVSWLKNAVHYRQWLSEDIRSSSQYLNTLHSLETISAMNDNLDAGPLTERLLKSTTYLGLALPTQPTTEMVVKGGCLTDKKSLSAAPAPGKDFLRIENSRRPINSTDSVHKSSYFQSSPPANFTCPLTRISPPPSMIFRITTPTDCVLIKDFDITIYDPSIELRGLRRTFLTHWQQNLEEEAGRGTLDIHVCGPHAKRNPIRSFLSLVKLNNTAISFVPMSDRTHLKTVGTWSGRCPQDDLVVYLLAILTRLVGWELGAIEISLVRIERKFIRTQNTVLVLAVWRRKYFWLFKVNGLDNFGGGIDLGSFAPFHSRATQFVVQGNM